MVLWLQETLFSFAHVRGSSPPRLDKALVKGKQDEAPRRSDTWFPLKSRQPNLKKVGADEASSVTHPARAIIKHTLPP